MPKIGPDGRRRVPRGEDWYNRPFDILIKLNPRWCTLDYIPRIVKALSGDPPAGMAEAAWKEEVKRRADVVKDQINAEVLRVLVAYYKNRSTTDADAAADEMGGGATSMFPRARTTFRGGSSFTPSNFSALAGSDSESESEEGPGQPDPVVQAKDTMRRWEGLRGEGKRLWPDGQEQAADGAVAASVIKLDMLGTGAFLKERCADTLPELLVLYRVFGAIPGSAAQVERDQGRARDYYTRKRCSLDAKWVEICSIIDAHRRDTPIDLAKVKKRTAAELEAGLPKLVREPDAWVFRQQDIGLFNVDFDLDEGAGAEEEKEGEWEVEEDVEGEPLRDEAEGMEDDDDDDFGMHALAFDSDEDEDEEVMVVE